MTKDFIDVPQGCYGIITHETPENIAGLVTSGMGPCSHIIVKNTNSNNMVLCHVDHATDLNDERHGLMSWIRKICPDNNYSNLTVSLGEHPDRPRFTAEESPEETISNRVKECLKVNNSTLINYLNFDNAPSPGYDYSICIKRENLEIKIIPEVEVDDVKEFIRDDCNCGVKDFEHEGRLLAGAIFRANEYAVDHSDTTNLHPPVIVFDGVSSEFLSIENMRTQNSFIDMDRVLRDAPSRSSSGSSGGNSLGNVLNFDVFNRSAKSRPGSEGSEEHYSGDNFEKVSSTSSKRSEHDSIIDESSLHSDSSQYKRVKTSSPYSEAASISDETENHNLRRSEKLLIGKKTNLKFRDMLFKNMSTAQIDFINNSPQKSWTHSSNKAILTNVDPKITLIPELNHLKDHRNNITNLVTKINDGSIKADTVICLERKEQGSSFGMKDVRLLANILEHNEHNHDDPIPISAKIRQLPIYQDAMLYNTAKNKGVQVVGIEGKYLSQSKESPEYHNTREKYMAERIDELSHTGKNVVFVVGAAHIQVLQLRLPSADVDTTGITDKIQSALENPSKQTMTTTSSRIPPSTVRPKSDLGHSI